MPIYEFECQACQKIEEKIMSSSDPIPSECETCGKGPMKKIVSQSAFILKGGGWYSEGYSSKNKPSSSSASESASESSSKSTSSEAKPSDSKSPEKSSPKESSSTPSTQS